MHPSSERFIEILQSNIELHNSKSQGYGRATDPFANVRASELVGLPGWVGALIRLNDKVVRLQVEAKRAVLRAAVAPYFDGVGPCDCGPCVGIRQEIDKSLPHEGPIDNMQDINVYAGIMQVLYEEDSEPAYVVAPREDWPDTDGFNAQLAAIFKGFDPSGVPTFPRDLEAAE